MKQSGVARLEFADASRAARTLMCLGVVLVHANFSLRPAIRNWWPAGILTAPFYSILVPVFFVISGYFASGRPGGEDTQTARPFFLRRLRRLLIPLLTWNVAMFLVGGGLVRPFTWQSLFDLVTGFWQLYFLFVLLQLQILHRFVLGSAPSQRKLKALLVATAALSLGYYVAANLTLWMRGTSATVFETHLDKSFFPWFFFFILGVWLRQVPAGLETLSRRARLGAALAALSYLTYVLELRLADIRLGAEPLGQFLLSGFVFQTSLSLLVLSWLSRWRRSAGPKFARGILSRLSGETYGIFLVHGVVLIELIRVLDRLGARLPSALEVPVFWAVAWLLSLGLVKAIRGTGIPFLRTVLLGESRSPASTAAAAPQPEGT